MNSVDRFTLVPVAPPTNQSNSSRGGESSSTPQLPFPSYTPEDQFLNLLYAKGLIDPSGICQKVIRTIPKLSITAANGFNANLRKSLRFKNEEGRFFSLSIIPFIEKILTKLEIIQCQVGLRKEGVYNHTDSHHAKEVFDQLDPSLFSKSRKLFSSTWDKNRKITPTL